MGLHFLLLYLRYVFVDFQQNVVAGAFWDRDELIGVCVLEAKDQSPSEQRQYRAQLLT